MGVVVRKGWDVSFELAGVGEGHYITTSMMCFSDVTFYGFG